MAFQGYLYIEGKHRGAIHSLLDSDLHEGAIPFQSYSHDIRVPAEFGIQKMLPRPIHGPLFISKNVDKTTPDLYRLFLSAEELTAKIKWYEVIDGEERLVYSINLDGAHIVSIDAIKHDLRDQRFDSYGIVEKVGFAYNRIAWDYELEESNVSFEFHTRVDYAQQTEQHAEDNFAGATHRESEQSDRPTTLEGGNKDRGGWLR